MEPASTSMLPIVIVTVVFAAIALGIGFVAGGWFLGGRGGNSAGGRQYSPEQMRQERISAEREVMASCRLKDLASGVASDVGQHNSLVGEITAELTAAKNGTAAEREARVDSALLEIAKANEILQRKLEKAERQIQAQAEEIREHESEARTDSLTKIANRRAFDDEMVRRNSEWIRKDTPFSMMILDVDHFKKFNDTHGHQAGDEVLREVAKSLQDSTRDMDIPCRYGGEEFAIILPATKARDVIGLAERVRESIANLKIPFEGKTLRVTASLGLAQIGVQEQPAALLKRADEALYMSKDAGRNCGHLSEDGKFLPIQGSGVKAPQRKKRKEEEIETKVLDSLPNRTKFAEELRRRVSECHRTAVPLTVMAIDFSDYHKLEAEFGHSVAQLTLDSVAGFLSQTLRDMDLLGQTTDSQFAAMLPTARAENAEVVASRIAKAMQGCTVPLGGKELQLAVRTGIAELETKDTAATLIERATEALAADAASELQTV